MRAADAIKSQREALTLLLQSQLPTITTKLYSKSIISSDALLEAINENHVASVRTVSLLSVIEDKIRAESHVFTEFVKILESEPTLRSQANEIVKKYCHGTYWCRKMVWGGGGATIASSPDSLWGSEGEPGTH